MFFESIKKGQHVHMIGIGGISMSGLAEILLKWGYKVSGSDITASDITNKLQEHGVDIFIPHNEKNIEDADIIVYTAAIKPDNPELIRAKELNIPTIDRATLLGEITKIYPKTIGISGTHGKTTTTSMIAETLVQSEKDPTILVGGELASIGGNYKIGGNEFLVTEACEYVESFLKFYPQAAIILNIEMDHLDYFKDIEQIKSAFRKYGLKVPKDGVIFGNYDDKNVIDVLKDSERKIISFAIDNESTDWKASNISYNSSGCAKFDAHYMNSYKGTIELGIPGKHNIYNALACLAACSYFGVEFSKVESSLKNFTGAKRRFEYKGNMNGIKIVDDYAHHPSEVKATLEAAAKQSPKSLWCVFQPHTYTRTKTLFNDFSTAFGAAKKVIIIDIYAAREKDTGLIHSRDLVKAINEKTNNAVYASSFAEAAKIIQGEAQPGDIVMTMGAGNVYKVGEMLLNSQTA